MSSQGLTLRFLGDVSVERAGASVALPPSRKTRALLAYLVLSGRPQRRERLCELFWELPDDPRGALRWSLSKLRPLVDEPERPRILADRETVAFDADGVFVDLLAARRQVEAGLSGLTPEELSDLADLFRGTFLEGLDFSELHQVQAWIVAERDTARRLHLAILDALVERLAGDPEAALVHARTRVQLDPLDERLWADLVRLLVGAGRRAEAAQQQETALRLLAEGGMVATGELAAAMQARPSPAALPSSLPETAAGLSLLHARQEIRFCRSADGVRIAYATVGSGPPLVKAPNWLSHLEYEWNSPVWRHWLHAFAERFTLVRYDQRGNGLSDWDVDDISFEAFVRDLEMVVEATGLQRFPVLGISRGCAIAIAYAVRNPDRVTRLVLYGGAALGWRRREGGKLAEAGEALLTLMRHGWGQANPAFRQTFTSMFVPDATPEQAHWFNELQRLTATPENAARIRDASGDYDIEALLPHIKVPTLVLHARGDAVCPFASGRALAASIPGARFVVLESRNHLLLEGEPAWQRFLDEAMAFLSEDA